MYHTSLLLLSQYLIFHWEGLSLSLLPPLITANNVYLYELVVPNQAAGVSVSNYIFPESLQLNYQSGLISWDSKFHQEYLPGEYLLAVKVSQFNKKEKYLGYVIRIFTVLLENIPLSKISIS